MRTWRVFSIGSVLAAVLAIAGCASAPAAPDEPDAPQVSDEPDAFDVHREQAVKDAATPEGKAYEREFFPAIGQELTDVLNRCTTEFPSAEGDSFEMVFRIDHFGEPKAVLVKPLTELSECVAKGAWYFVYPRPDEKYTGLGVALLVPVTIK